MEQAFALLDRHIINGRKALFYQAFSGEEPMLVSIRATLV